MKHSWNLRGHIMASPGSSCTAAVLQQYIRLVISCWDALFVDRYLIRYLIWYWIQYFDSEGKRAECMKISVSTQLRPTVGLWDRLMSPPTYIGPFLEETVNSPNFPLFPSEQWNFPSFLANLFRYVYKSATRATSVTSAINNEVAKPARRIGKGFLP